MTANHKHSFEDAIIALHTGKATGGIQSIKWLATKLLYYKDDNYYVQVKQPGGYINQPINPKDAFFSFEEILCDRWAIFP